MLVEKVGVIVIVKKIDVILIVELVVFYFEVVKYVFYLDIVFNNVGIVLGLFFFFGIFYECVKFLVDVNLMFVIIFM